MADTTPKLAASGRPILRLPAQAARTAAQPDRPTLYLPVQPAPRIAPVAEYARAYMLRIARALAERNAARRAARRAELKARAFEAVASDRRGDRA